MKEPEHPIQPLIAGEDGTSDMLSFQDVENTLKPELKVLWNACKTCIDQPSEHALREFQELCHPADVMLLLRVVAENNRPDRKKPFRVLRSEQAQGKPHAIQMAEREFKIRKSLEKDLPTMRPDTVDDLIQALDNSDDDDLGAHEDCNPGGPAIPPELN